MRSPIAILCVVLLVGALGSAATGQEPVPLEQEIQSLVQDLGHERYDVREEATEKLRRIGLPALEALERAAESDDPEVRTRARNVLRDVRLGITPDWPAETVLMVRHYDDLPEAERGDALQRIGDTLKDKAVPFLLLRMAEGRPSEATRALDCLRRINTEEAHKRVIELLKEPKSTEQQAALAWALARTGRALEALQVLERSRIHEVWVRHDAIEAGVKQILEQLDNREFGKVAEVAGAFAQVSAEDARFLYLQAEGLVALDQEEEAQALRERALALTPEEEAPHYTAGEMLGELGRRRLAAREWEAILKIPSESNVYDINAYLRLGSIYAASGLYGRAADSFSKGLEQFLKAREAGHGMGMFGGDEASLRKEIEGLREKAKQFPAGEDATVKDALGEDELVVSVTITVKDGKMEQLRRALAEVARTFSVNVEPFGLRIFDVAPVSLSYDTEKEQILMLLNNSPCCKPMPFSAEGPKAQVAIRALDCCYIFEIDTTTGAAERLARFEKDYTVKLRPGIRLAGCSDLVAKINEEEYDWAELLQGVEMDYLPKVFDIELEGTRPSGKHIAARSKIKVEAPDVEPAPGPRDG